MDDSGHCPPLTEIEQTRAAIAPFVRTTPLIRLGGTAADQRIYLKLENLQDIGSFKIRTAAALALALSPEQRQAGLCTASSGNFGIAVVTMGAHFGVPVTVVVPDTSPAYKLDRLASLGARIRRVSTEAWWETILTRRFPDMEGYYLDAVTATAALAGNGSIGLEILEQLPEVDAIVVPFGGGGIACGIAAAVKPPCPHIRIIAAESELAAPLTGARRAGKPVTVPWRDGFISGIGVDSVMPQMWPLLQVCVDDSVVVGLAEVGDAIRRVVSSNHVVAEGAGAVPVAAALSGAVAGNNIVCVITGGNISNSDLATILNGEIPG